MENAPSMLKELKIKVSYLQEEMNRHVVRYYNHNNKEKFFKNGDLALKKLDIDARQSTLGMLFHN